MKAFTWLAYPMSLLFVTALIAFEGPLHAAQLLLAAFALACGAAAVFGIGYTLLAGALIRRFFALDLGAHQLSACHDRQALAR